MKVGYAVPGKPGEPPELGPTDQYVGYVTAAEMAALGIEVPSVIGGARLTAEQDAKLAAYIERRDRP